MALLEKMVTRNHMEEPIAGSAKEHLRQLRDLRFALNG